MRPRKLFNCFIVVFVALGLVLLSLPANAQTYYDCKAAQISKAGVTASGIIVRLADVSDTPKWTGARNFYLAENVGKTGLAVALTGLSLGKTLWCRIEDPNAAQGSLISIIYVNEQ